MPIQHGRTALSTTITFIPNPLGTGAELVVQSGLTAPAYPLLRVLAVAHFTTTMFPAADTIATVVLRLVVKSGVTVPRHPQPWTITPLNVAFAIPTVGPVLAGALSHPDFKRSMGQVTETAFFMRSAMLSGCLRINSAALQTLGSVL